MVEAFVEPGSSATDDRRPALQAMIEAATTKPPAFDAILVHSFSCFFRDQLQFELYVRNLAKNGVRIISITQETGDEPMGAMIRKIVTLFDEYQSKENAKRTLRAMCENARQGFWNGSRPPIGYRTVEAGKRGTKVKKTLAIDPLHAETVRLIYRLALEGDQGSRPMCVKSVASFLNASDIRTRDGGRWGVSGVHEVLTWHHLHRPASVQPAFCPRQSLEGGRRARGHHCAAIDRRSGLSRGAAPAPCAQPEGHAAARRERSDAADRHCHLRRL